MKTTILIVIILISLAANLIAAEDIIVIGGLDGLDPETNAESYPIVLALSGGGSRGLAIIGVLKAFQEKSIRVAGISGTSIGGVIGGLYASGYSPDELTSIVNGIDLEGFFSNQPTRRSMLLTRRQERDRHLISIRFKRFRPVIPRGLTAGQRLASMLTTLTTSASYRCGGLFDQLPIPFLSVATDIITGEAVILDRGSLAVTMRATLAFPLAFTPQELNGRLLMDGGMVNPLPVDLARATCDTVDFVVAINTTSPLLSQKLLKSPVDMANQVTTIMSSDNLSAALNDADYVIEPVPDNIASTDFSIKDSLINLGYRAGLTAADSIINLIHQRRDQTQRQIDRVLITGISDDCAHRIKTTLEGLAVTRAGLVEHLRLLLHDCHLFRLEARLKTDDSTSFVLHLDAVEQINIDHLTLSFSGNTIFDDSTFAAILFEHDRVVTSPGLRRGLNRITDLYSKRGYDLANFTEVTFDSQQEELVVVIDEAAILSIDIENARRTRDWFIRSNFPLKVGEPYSSVRASKGLSNIYGTDLFDRVSFDLQPDSHGARVKIRIEEKNYHQLRLGWHWDDRYQSEEFAEFLDDHLFGAGLEYLIHARYAQDRHHFFVRFKADRIFSTFLTAGLRAFHRQMDRNIFDEAGEIINELEESRWGAEFLVGQQISKLGTVSAALVMEEVEVSHPDTNTSEQFGLRSLRFESLVETFDRIPITRSGKKHHFVIQMTGKYLGGEVEFTRFYSSIEAYWPIGKFLNYHPMVAVGISRSNLPASERFYLGGMRSFSGFQTHELTGDKLFQLSQEFRARLLSRLYFTVRYDLGDVYSSADQIKLKKLRSGVGFIVTFESPIGPFEFGYGFTDKNRDRFYLNIGLDF